MKPFLVKDHNYELPIHSIEFQDTQDLVLSMDTKILKMWNRNTVIKTHTPYCHERMSYHSPEK